MRVRRREAERRVENPMRFLLKIPVPWVFVLTYLVGVAVELTLRPQGLVQTLPGVAVGGAVLFGIGAAIAGWGLLTFRRARTL